MSYIFVLSVVHHKRTVSILNNLTKKLYFCINNIFLYFRRIHPHVVDRSHNKYTRPADVRWITIEDLVRFFFYKKSRFIPNPHYSIFWPVFRWCILQMQVEVCCCSCKKAAKFFKDETNIHFYGPWTNPLPAGRNILTYIAFVGSIHVHWVIKFLVQTSILDAQVVKYWELAKHAFFPHFSSFLQLCFVQLFCMKNVD